MEAQALMTTNMISTCKDKTISKKHNSEQLSEAEKTAFMNCCTKYFEAPNSIMGAMNNAMGGGG